MLPLRAEIRTDAPIPDQRSAGRRTLRLEVSATSSQETTTALIHNLSEAGLLLETSADLQVGDLLQVHMPHSGATTGLVVWSRGNFAGCKFVSPVSKGAVSAALLKNGTERAQPVAPPLVRPEPDPDHDFIEELQHQLGGSQVQLRALSDSIRGNDQQAAKEELVRSIIRFRSQRSKFFDEGLFADPAWDILLDLYVSEVAQQRVSVSSLCVASNVPQTTALRWIKRLERNGLIERSSDPMDGRRYYMSLSEKGRCAMDEYFSSLLGWHA